MFLVVAGTHTRYEAAVFYGVAFYGSIVGTLVKPDTGVVGMIDGVILDGKIGGVISENGIKSGIVKITFLDPDVGGVVNAKGSYIGAPKTDIVKGEVSFIVDIDQCIFYAGFYRESSGIL